MITCRYHRGVFALQRNLCMSYRVQIQGQKERSGTSFLICNSSQKSVMIKNHDSLITLAIIGVKFVFISYKKCFKIFLKEAKDF